MGVVTKKNLMVVMPVLVTVTTVGLTSRFNKGKGMNVSPSRRPAVRFSRHDDRTPNDRARDAAFGNEASVPTPLWPAGLARRVTRPSRPAPAAVDPFRRWDDVVLLGVWLGDRDAWAWIQAATGTERLKAGDVYRGAVLKSIRDGEVVFEQEGVRRAVRLNRQPNGTNRRRGP